MICKPARYFLFPAWTGPGHTTRTGRPSSASPMSRASAGGILRAPGRPVDLDRYALRVGSRSGQVKRHVRAGVREQPRALAEDHRDDGKGDLLRWLNRCFRCRRVRAGQPGSGSGPGRAGQQPWDGSPRRS